MTATHLGFIETKRLVRATLTDMGERCSCRRAHTIARVLFAIWNGDEYSSITYLDPTGEVAVKKILARTDLL